MNSSSSSSSTSSTSSTNFYNVLGVSSSASSREIKFARDRLARQAHPDRGGTDALMQAINKAWDILSDPMKRSDYDNNREDRDDFVSAPITGFLSCGLKLSDEFKAKIYAWKSKGVPETDKTFFVDASTVDPYQTKPYVEKKSTVELNPPLSSYKKLLRSIVPIIETILSQVLPPEIFNWAFKKLSLIPKEVFASPAWQKELPPAIDNPLLKINYNAFYREACNERHDVCNMLHADKSQFCVPHAQSLKTELTAYIKNKSTATFKSSTRHPVGTNIPLCPPSMYYELGVIPQHNVQAHSVTLDSQSKNCSGCAESFGIFRWQTNCMMCGNADCSSCLIDSYLPEYVTPVQICKECLPNKFERFSKEWLAPLENAHDRARITGKYLSLIASLGYAVPQKFLEWTNLFFKEKRPDLAIQCNYLGQGDWMELASKFLKEKEYSFAKMCLNFLENKTKEWWEQQGEANLQTNPHLALLAYQRAGYQADDYIKIAFKYSDCEISKLCVIAALNCPHRNINLLDEIVTKAMAQDKTLLALYALILGNSSTSEWIKYVNKSDINNAASFMKCMNETLGFNVYGWGNIHFAPDRDHLRWEFMPHTDFDSQLRYLIESLQTGGGANHILYFRSKFKDENFVVRRDEYLSQGDYTKALLCHRLISNAISWTELAQKWRSKDESASLACHILAGDDINTLGDRMFEQGNHSFALHCYLQTENFAKIEEKIKTPNTPFRIFYLFALWKHQPNQNDLILDICRTLLSEPSNANAVQQILIHELKNSKNAKNLAYHKMLADTKISNVDLVGLVETVESLCQKPSEKRWREEKLVALKEIIWDLLRKAIFHGSLKEVVELVDLINPMTLTTVRGLLSQFDIEGLERGPKKSTALVVRAMAYMFQTGESRYLYAMNDITEAMLSDPGEENYNYYAQIVEKISHHITKNWRLRGRAATSLHKSKTSEHTKRLKHHPDLRVLIKGEECIGKFKPLDAAMAYIDLSKGISYAPALVASYLSAALELTKVMGTLDRYSQKEEQYAYRRAVVELVNSCYFIGRSHLCPATQLYVMRSGIAILTNAYRHFYYISKPEQEILDNLYSEIDHLSQTSPFALGRMVHLFDVVFLDLINREFSAVYFPLMRTITNKSIKPDPRYQYHIFAERWKGNFEEKIFKFEEERRRTMEALLKDKGNTMEDVQDIMQWPATVRDNNGWLPEQPLPLNLVDEKFSRLNGFRYDKETGEIEFLLESSSDPMQSVFDLDDIADVLQLGVTDSFLTLEEEDPQFPYHPFQKIMYAPDCISRTNHLATLLHADIRLKEIVQKTEISANSPFALRDAEQSLLKRLPEDFQKELKDCYKEMSDTAERVCRYWIEAGELPYYQTEDSKGVTFKFGDCVMSVLTHKMMRNQQMNLVDTPDETEKNSPDRKMAELLTREYATLGKVFPEFKRLEELAKLQAMAKIIQGLYQDALYRAERAFGVEKERILRICQTFQRAAIAIQTDATVAYDKCRWVPSAFKKNGKQRVYGGVNLNAKLVSGGGNGGGIRARYVESMDSYGVLRGHAYTANTVNQQMTRFLYLKGSILDEYNSHQRRLVNITALWKTGVGYTNVHHTTTHTNNYHHTHYTSGNVQCRSPDNRSQFYRHDIKSHRCGHGSYN